MKRRFQKLNRGLLLGGIGIVLTTSYVLIDNHQFNKSKPKIEEFMKNYVNDVYQANVSKETNDTSASSNHLTNITNLYDKYWIQHAKSGTDYYQRKNDIERQINECKENLSVDSREDAPISAYQCETNIRQMKIKKDGPKNALVTLTLDCTLYSNSIGRFSGIDGINQISFDSEDSALKKYQDSLSNGSAKIKYYTSKADVSVYLTESDGEWKIYGADNIWGSSDTISLIDSKTGKELTSFDVDDESSSEDGMEDSNGNSN